MYEKILVPLDGSKPSEAVLPYARELVKGLDSQITLISVLPAGSIIADSRSLRSLPAGSIQNISFNIA